MPVRNIVIGQNVSQELKERAKELRRTMTPAEKILWEQLRHNRFKGLQFRRQQIIARCIVDFYCHSIALVIEVDGDIHDLQQEYDVERDQYLMARGFRVLHVTNDEVTGRLSMIDLLLYGDTVRHDSKVNLPHPDIRRYAFVLRPLADIAPDLRHPETGLAYAEMWQRFDAGKQEMWKADFNPQK